MYINKINLVLNFFIFNYCGNSELTTGPNRTTESNRGEPNLNRTEYDPNPNRTIIYMD